MSDIIVGIVPTPVGVNRCAQRYTVDMGDCPHARGGEPDGRLFRVVTV